MAKDAKFKSLFEYYGFTKSDEKKYPVISGILKELTPERIEKEIKEVQKVELPKEIKKWVKEYEKVGDRNPFIWKWLYKMFEGLYLPVASKKYKESLIEIKILTTMYVVLLDDVADKTKNHKFLNEIFKTYILPKYIEWKSINKKEKKYAKLALNILNYIKKTIKKYPKYNKIKDILHFDLMQVLNAIHYSSLINKNPYLINKSEQKIYPCFNMVAFVYSDLDLMCSLKLNFKNLTIFREIIWRAQKMARIGNWVSTWEREVYEEDYTSGVFIYAAINENIKIEELKNKNKEKIINKIKKSGEEKKLLKEWENNYREIQELKKRKQKNKLLIDQFLFKLKKLLILHLISRTYK